MHPSLRCVSNSNLLVSGGMGNKKAVAAAKKAAGPIWQGKRGSPFFCRSRAASAQAALGVGAKIEKLQRGPFARILGLSYSLAVSPPTTPSPKKPKRRRALDVAAREAIIQLYGRAKAAAAVDDINMLASISVGHKACANIAAVVFPERQLTKKTRNHASEFVQSWVAKYDADPKVGL